jgi:hypothetical protein
MFLIEFSLAGAPLRKALVSSFCGHRRIAFGGDTTIANRSVSPFEFSRFPIRRA